MNSFDIQTVKHAYAIEPGLRIRVLIESKGFIDELLHFTGFSLSFISQHLQQIKSL